MAKWLPTNNFPEEVILWVQRMSDMLDVSDGATDDPMGLSWSMGVAMSVRLLAEWWFELHSKIFPVAV